MQSGDKGIVDAPVAVARSRINKDLVSLELSVFLVPSKSIPVLAGVKCVF